MGSPSRPDSQAARAGPRDAPGVDDPRLAAVAPEAAPPEERDYLARQLTVTLRLGLLAVLVAGLVSVAAGFHVAPLVFLTLLPVWFALRLTRRGQLDLASGLVVTWMLLFVTWLVYVGEGLQDIAMLLYPVVVLLAGMLMPRRPFVVVVVSTLLLLALIAWGQSRGHVHLMQEGLRAYLPAYFVVAAIVIAVAAVIAHLLSEDLRRSLRQTRRNEERYRLISELSSDYVFSTVVDPDGRVRQDWVAGAFSAMTGFDFEDYLARGGWRAALHPDDVARDEAALDELRANRPVTCELRTFTRGGAVRWVRVYARPVWNAAENRLAGIYGAVQDVTEAKRAERDREALIRELEAKNAELERFSYTASHDLKSPLVTIRGFLGFLERDARAGNLERFERDLGRIQAATDKMATLLDELLELSRVGRVVNPPESVELGELAAEVVALLAGPIAERKARVRIAEDLPTVWGDRTRLLQVLQNLVENALKFSGERARPLVEIGARHDDDGPVFFVRDSGIGLEPSQRERVFGLFDKLDPKSPGAGVGLALVRRIVELHQGRVWVESEGPGRGSTVCFTLAPAPARGGPAADVTPAG